MSNKRKQNKKTAVLKSLVKPIFIFSFLLFESFNDSRKIQFLKCFYMHAHNTKHYINEN